MNIVVLVKQVPDTWAERSLSVSDATLDRDAVDAVIDENEEYAIEEGLRLREAHGGVVTVVSMGPERAADAVRKALSMGVDDAVHVSDPVLHGACVLQTARVLAAALGTVEWDVVVAGSESTDARLSVVPAVLAEATGATQLTHARRVTVAGSTVTIERQTDGGFDTVVGSTPAVVSVVEKINDPRYPSFKGIMAAKKKPVRTVTVADLGLSPDEVGLASASTRVLDFRAAPPRQAGVVVRDDAGSGAGVIAEFLQSKKLI